MEKAKFTFEQYCTHLKRNVVMEERIYENGERKTICVEKSCDSMNDECKNKIRKNK